MPLSQASTIRGDRYCFEVHLLNGSRKPNLRRGFLRQMDISWDDGYIVLEDNTTWELYAEQDVIDAMRFTEKVYCIISFQCFYNGEQIAVARLYNADKDHKAAERSDDND